MDRSIMKTSADPAITTKENEDASHPTLDKLNAMGLAGTAKAFGELSGNGEAATSLAC
ncbi:hypothetical protein EDE09_1137 [Neorhizobium sp. S3-V5DH]|nr:hypothetical protein EDE09_1137 [Neorhizobium sp. S3-V5DH]